MIIEISPFYSSLIEIISTGLLSFHLKLKLDLTTEHLRPPVAGTVALASRALVRSTAFRAPNDGLV